MPIDRAIYELIGAIANVAVANGGTKVRLNELAAILTILDVESNLWDHYTNRTDFLINKAYDYFTSKDPQKAANIKATVIKKDGVPLIP
jgi:hypothetical protein